MDEICLEEKSEFCKALNFQIGDKIQSLSLFSIVSFTSTFFLNFTMSAAAVVVGCCWSNYFSFLIFLFYVK